ncbi:hypothetical protein E2C01_018162 [Portunus trituberculatus]|uniref:Uncharacterized protein n=1 Tax=Portunus trituberculatus TaxID=210409 RepID=A0A5B7DVN5_PORTR|nr:hypothetical protein [Portunus trituberculatus]
MKFFHYEVDRIATWPRSNSSACKEPPDFGTVIMEWLETEPGRFGDEVIMECPNKHRNSEDISLTTITVGCTAEGWKTLTTCMKCELLGLCWTQSGVLSSINLLAIHHVYNSVHTHLRRVDAKLG